MDNRADLKIRRGASEDVPQILQLIKQLAEYEKCLDQATLTEEQLRNDGFGPNPSYLVWVAERDGNILGMALCYWKYSTWKGNCLYLEDLVVDQAQRGQGVGSLLFDAVRSFAADSDVGRLEWQVLDWNEPAINFYNSLGATLDSEWINCKLTRTQLQENSN